MNRSELESQLVDAMKRLDEAADKVARTSGYTRETKKVRLLLEIIKEQIRNENPVPATRTVR